ncbi:MAG: S-adenosylmethionine-dependent methyltransferase, partial [Pseudomonadota bacterium]
IVAVSSETLGKDAFDSRGWRVGPRHRFAHAESYLRQSLEGIGLTLLVCDPIVVRMEDDLPVPGHLVLARNGSSD